MCTVYDIYIIYSISMNPTYYMKYRYSEFNIEDTSHMLIIKYVYAILVKYYAYITCISHIYIYVYHEINIFQN